MAASEILEIVVQFGFMIGAAFLAAALASKRFRSERLWDRKAQAYSDLIDGLHHMKFYSNENYEAAIESRDLPEDYAEELWQSYKKARNDVVRIAESSSFLIAGEVEVAVKALEEAMGSARHTQYWQENYETRLVAIEECLKHVKLVGAKELETGA
jgi:hypothetical protein